MAEASATLSDYRQSPRKVRLVADMVRGKSVAEAITALSFVPKRAALPIQKLLASAVANAKSRSLSDNLIVKEIGVDTGKILYRRLPMSRGRAFVMRKRTSHVKVVLAESELSPKKAKKAQKAQKAKKESTE